MKPSMTLASTKQQQSHGSSGKSFPVKQPERKPDEGNSTSKNDKGQEPEDQTTSGGPKPRPKPNGQHRSIHDPDDKFHNDGVRLVEKLKLSGKDKAFDPTHQPRDPYHVPLLRATQIAELVEQGHGQELVQYYRNQGKNYQDEAHLDDEDLRNDRNEYDLTSEPMKASVVTDEVASTILAPTPAKAAITALSETES